MTPEKIQIADEALNRVSSCNGDGIYSQQRRKSGAEVKEQAVSEKEIVDGGDERDIRKKQVRMLQLISHAELLTYLRISVVAICFGMDYDMIVTSILY